MTPERCAALRAEIPHIKEMGGFEHEKIAECLNEIDRLRERNAELFTRLNLQISELIYLNDLWRQLNEALAERHEAMMDVLENDNRERLPYFAEQGLKAEELVAFIEQEEKRIVG